ncbi:uncharacterized protein LOC111638389 [Centruroides sculpturatus]|uniref:uncharacterized protein LOC111638389 n=1 Tax=Centruroides sculpturatus TaxID=218467 RepID=UPI000C6EFD04|nr:uncharacterized protein LOC111638389 [Centruroides sculpturatus]
MENLPPEKHDTGNLFCKICKIIFENPSQLRIHLKSHSRELRPGEEIPSSSKESKVAKKYEFSEQTDISSDTSQYERHSPGSEKQVIKEDYTDIYEEWIAQNPITSKIPVLDITEEDFSSKITPIQYEECSHGSERETTKRDDTSDIYEEWIAENPISSKIPVLDITEEDFSSKITPIPGGYTHESEKETRGDDPSDIYEKWILEHSIIAEFPVLDLIEEDFFTENRQIQDIGSIHTSGTKEDDDSRSQQKDIPQPTTSERPILDFEEDPENLRELPLEEILKHFD